MSDDQQTDMLKTLLHEARAECARVREAKERCAKLPTETLESFLHWLAQDYGSVNLLAVAEELRARRLAQSAA